MNDLSILFADLLRIFIESENESKLQLLIDQESVCICNWLEMNRLTLNTQKTVYQIYGHLGNSSELNMKLNNVTIDRMETVKYLGVYIDSGLKWAAHIVRLTFTISRNIGIISRVKYFLNKQSLLLLYNTLVLQYINYCCFIWGFIYQNYISKIELLQKRVVRIIDNQHRLAHSFQTNF